MIIVVGRVTVEDNDHCSLEGFRNALYKHFDGRAGSEKRNAEANSDIL